ncbi:transcriptional regulator [Azospirillum humicireducens]|nr:transcriptional regulator [Azospirillum humicireducens]
MNSIMTPDQCRTARNLLDWSVGDLGRRSGADLEAVAGFENGRNAADSLIVTSLRRTFESVGVEFINWGSGARLS